MQGNSALCCLSDDLLFSVLQRGGPACLGRLRATSFGLSLRCASAEPRLYHHYLCTAFAALVSQTEECGDAGFSLVKLAVPCLTLVVEIRGETHATQSWVNDELLPRHKPWDGDIGSIQELFYGVSTVKASSYKEAYKMCARKQVEDAVSKAQMAVNEHDRRRQELAFAVGAVRMEYTHLSKACSRLKAERKARERQEILRQAKAREPNAWAPAPVRWAEAGREAKLEAAKDSSWATDAVAATRRAQCATPPGGGGRASAGGGAAACAGVQEARGSGGKAKGGDGDACAAVAACGTIWHAAPGQSLAALQKTLTRDADAKKAQLVATCKELEGVEQESKILRLELMGLKRQLRKLGGREEAMAGCASSATLPRCLPRAACRATLEEASSHGASDAWGLCMQFP